MQSYLGITSGTVKEKFVASRRTFTLNLNLKEENGPPLPVEKCCHFLCKFAKINQENQRALFQHIAYLLEHAEKYPGLLACDGYTPLDVATATIRDNRELALALQSSHLEHVVQLMVSITTDSMDSPSPSPSMRRTGSRTMLQAQTTFFSVDPPDWCRDWNPNGGRRCLEFLQAAVWVDSKAGGGILKGSGALGLI